MIGSGAGKLKALEDKEAELEEELKQLKAEIKNEGDAMKKALLETRRDTKEKLLLSVREERLKLEGVFALPIRSLTVARFLTVVYVFVVRNALP